MSRPGRTAAAIRVFAAFVGVALAGPAVTGTAWATTPSSTATCSGSLAPSSSGGSQEPNLLDYSFSCTADITAYTFVINRVADQPNNIDDFEPSPVVLDTSGNPSSTETFSCSGAVPGNGFNCNAPTGTPMTTGYTAIGSLDPTAPYCKHLPPGGKPGTPAVPQLQVQVIVTDVTGASDGPFTLDITAACKSVPDTVPYPPPPRPKPVHSCSGKLSRDPTPTSSEPNLLDYHFSCDAAVTAYTLVVTRRPGQYQNIDAFNPYPLVLEPGGAPSPTQSFSCAGSLPGSGFDCTAGSAGQMSAGNSAHGSFNPIDPYCKRLPKGASPGTPAEPQAQVELLVSDGTGALRGPFPLDLTHACPAVPNSVPPSTRPH